MNEYPRDMVGYGQKRPQLTWPDGSKIAVQFVLNYEEGAENSILHGDPASEIFLSEIIGAAPFEGARHMSMESIYEYGSRAGVWRILDLFRSRKVPITLFAVAMAMQRNPLVIEQALKDGHEIASHGYRWINYHGMPKSEEMAHMEKAIDIHKDICGERPLGWYTGRTSPNTLKLIAERDDILYCADSYADDLPYYDCHYAKPLLMVPYTLDTNDMRFATAQGFNSGEQFFTYLKDAFDVLYEEGENAPKMLSIGLHNRIIGRPARIAALKRFIEYIKSHDKVWIATREDIAKHWLVHHPINKNT